MRNPGHDARLIHAHSLIHAMPQQRDTGRTYRPSMTLTTRRPQAPCMLAVLASLHAGSIKEVYPKARGGVMPESDEDPRSPITVRVRLPSGRRVRLAAVEEDTDQQDIVDQALEEWLTAARPLRQNPRSRRPDANQEAGTRGHEQDPRRPYPCPTLAAAHLLLPGSPQAEAEGADRGHIRPDQRLHGQLGPDRLPVGPRRPCPWTWRPGPGRCWR